MSHKLSIPCPHCHLPTSIRAAQHSVSLGMGHREIVADLVWHKSRDEEWWIGICNNCEMPSLIRNNGSAIFPFPFPVPSDKRIPSNIRADLDEASVCASVGAFRACAVMARRAIQVACIDKAAKKNNLDDQVKELKDNGIITNDLKEWADAVRWVGNDGAHPNSFDVTSDDAIDILKLAEQFLTTLYVTPEIARELRAQRGK